MTTIQWSRSPRPDTGVTNGTLGLWLFLAAEVMFFGSLLSSYVLLRLGNGDLWASEGLQLGAMAGSWKAAVLVASSATLHLAARKAKARRPTGGLLVATLLLGGAFLGARASELATLAAAGLVPKSGVATAMYYTVSGLHGLHLLVVAILVATSRIGAASRQGSAAPRRLRNLAVAWHFFVAVWLVFVVLFHLS